MAMAALLALSPPIGKDYGKIINQWGDNSISATDAGKVRLIYGTKLPTGFKLTKQDK